VNAVTNDDFLNYVKELWDFYLFLDEMFDVKWHLGTQHDYIVVDNVRPAFWRKTVEPCLPVWTWGHIAVPSVGERRIIYLKGVPRNIQCFAALKFVDNKWAARQRR
jgi:hypothetical protein